MGYEKDDAFEARRREIMQKRKAAKARRRKAMMHRLLILFIIAAIIALAILSLTVFFPVKNITVKGDVPYTSEEIIKASGIEKGKNLWMTGSDAEEDIPKSLPYIASAEVDRKFPSSVVITVKKANAVYCYKTEKEYLLCDAEGKVLETASKANEKLISVIGSTAKSTKAGNALSYEDDAKQTLVSKLITALNENSITVNSVDVTDNYDIILRVDGRFNVEFGSEGNASAKAAHLAEMIKKIDKDRAGSIDLSDYSPENSQGIFTQE